MKNVAKNAVIIAMTSALMGVNTALAAITPNAEPINPGIVTEGSLEDVVQVWIERLLGFLYIIAVIYALWGGFQILTAAGDDEKVSKGKNIIIQALIGIVVIFLAGSIVQFVLGGILNAV